jgi:hypothetical protein
MKNFRCTLIISLQSLLIAFAVVGCHNSAISGIKPTSPGPASSVVSTTTIFQTATSIKTSPAPSTAVSPSITLSPPTLTYTTNTAGTSTSDYFAVIEYLFYNGAKIVSQDKMHTFLGTISDKYNFDSIFNQYGDNGSQYYSTSILNKNGDYGGKFGTYSPFNQFSTAPPEIYLGATFYGYLSVSKYTGYVTIDPNDVLDFGFLQYKDASYLDLKLL